MSNVMINPDQVDSYADNMKSLATKMVNKINEVHSLAQSMKNVSQDEFQESFDADFAKLSQGFAEFAQNVGEYTSAAKNHASIMRQIGRG